MIKPHGGILINKALKGEKRLKAIRKSRKYYHIKLSHDRIQEIANMATGLFSPLDGFLTREQLVSVLEKKRLPDGIAWTIPIVLDIPRWAYADIKKQRLLTLTDDKSKPIAIMAIKEIYGYDKKNFARKIYNTLDLSHPGVREVMSMGDYLIGGPIELINTPDCAFKQYAFTPAQTRREFEKRHWKTIVAFQTRNVPHIGHEYLQKTALSYTNGLFINPVIGKKKKGDFKDEVILSTYEALIKNYYPRKNVFLSILQMEMRYAGPREAIHHAIVRKNFGCTHIIIGRDHAGVGSFYHPFAAHEIFKEFPDLDIKPIFFKSFFECKKCGSVANDKTCPHKGRDIIDFSGTEIRNLLLKGKVPSERLMRPEVSRIILKNSRPFVE